MNVMLGNPGLLPWMALVAAPLLIHLFARSRPRDYPFSSVRFIEQVVRKTARLQRPQAWLILLLRTLLFAALLAMVLKPVWIHSDPLAGADQRKNVIILVDTSASMAAQDGPRARFAAATARAAEIVAGLGVDDSANVIWVGRRARSEFASPAVNKPALLQALRSASGSMEEADWRGAFPELERQVKAGDGLVEIYIISDFQQANWNGIAIEKPSHARLVLIQVGESKPGNQAIVKASAAPADLLVGEEAEVVCEVANYSDEPVLRTLYFRAGERVEKRELRLPPNGKAGASFSFGAKAAGEQVIELTLDEDAFPFDNEFFLPVRVEDKLRIALSGGEPETRERMRAALEAVDSMEIVPSSEGALPPAAVWIIAGWDGTSNAEIVEEFRRNGGGVIAMPEEGAKGLLSGGENPVWRIRRFDAPVALNVANREHSSVKLFEKGEFGDPAGGRLSARLETAGKVAGGIVCYADGVPAVALLSDKPSPLYLWNIPLDGENGSWAERVEFVPFLAELVLSARGGVTDQGRTGLFEAGEKLTRAVNGEVLEEELEVFAENVGYRVVKVPGKINNLYTTEAAVGPGAYQWRYLSSGIGYSAVNLSNKESDLRSVQPPASLSAGATSLAASQSISELREGLPLWPWFLAAALLFALVEGIVVWRTQRRPA